MKESEFDLRAELLRELNAFKSEIDPNIFANVKKVLLRNLQRERVRKFTHNHQDQIKEYILRVVHYYEKYSEYIHDLQIYKKDTVWLLLADKMNKWVYSYLVKQGFAFGDETAELAAEYAHEAVIILQDAYYPYDTEFDAWARVLVRNVCKKQIRSATTKSKIPNNIVVGLEDVLYELSDKQNIDKDTRIDLINAVAELTPIRQQVLLLLYFEGLSTEEVADRLGKSVSAVYGLHFQAIRGLRKIFGAKGNSDDR